MAISHENFLTSLHQLADLSGQARAWIHQEKNGVPDPGELLCEVFDDSGVDQMLTKGVAFSPEADRELRQLSSLADETDVTLAPEELLVDERWRDLVKQASVALRAVEPLLRGR